MTDFDFQNIHYRRVSSSDEENGEEGHVDVATELPPAVVTTKGSEKNSQWSNIENLDDFFIRIYEYHKAQGFACLLLSSIFELLQYVFIVLFATFLMVCVDYKQLFESHVSRTTFSEVIDWKKVENMPSSLILCLIVAFFFWLLRLAKVIHQGLKAWHMRNFYATVLHITDAQLADMQWGEVQQKLVEIQQVYQISIINGEVLTELDIHHRILRQKNYFLALQNKGVLPFEFDIPYLGRRTFLTEGLKYNLNFLLFKGPGALFGTRWKLKSEYKDYGNRTRLSQALGKRIFFLGLVNLLLCPFILVYQILHSFFTYAEMIKRSPDVFGARRWSQYGRLYLRHFNELDHEFTGRLCKAYKPATQYMNSFSSTLLEIVAHNIAFFAGAILSVLILLSIYDADVLEMEHVLLYMAILGGIVKVCTGCIPNENEVFCPQLLMKQILSHAHYIPDEWKGKAHTSEVRKEFSNIFQYKFVHLLEELLSPLLTPLILCVSISGKSQQIVDFFRNFTVELTGVGDVCSYAQMDVRRHGNKRWCQAAVDDTSSDEQQAENGKTELSLLHFSMKNPTWAPTDSGKQFIKTIKEHTIQESLNISQQHDFNSQSLFNMSFKEDFSRRMSLHSLAQVPLIEVDLKTRETEIQETLLNSSVLHMHELHDSLRHDSVTMSTSDIHTENLGTISRSDGRTLSGLPLPTLEEPTTESSDGSWHAEKM